MTEMPLSIPLDVKIKGLKNLVVQVTNLAEGQLILAGAVGELQQGMRELMTNVEALGTSLENIQGDITSLRDARETEQAANVATIAQLRTDVEAATAQKALDDETISSLNEAVNTAEASLNTAKADFDASLQPLVDRAAAIDAQTPGATTPTEPAPPVEETPAEPTPPVEETPAEPAPPVEEPAPADPNAPVDGNVEPA